MKFFIVGLGSMGKRRIRCLQALNYFEIGGFDVSADRRAEARSTYNISVYEDFFKAFDTFKPDALIISVPPDKHIDYMNFAIEHQVHFFVEASVVDEGFAEAIKKLASLDIVAAPSMTLMFHPAIRLIQNVVLRGELGKISNILLHSGQYLPDWHVYENVSEYYVSNPATGGAREILPFELTWFTMIFGYPKRVAGNFRKTIEISGAEKIDDTYNALLDYGNFLAVVTVDVVSRFATRRIIINGSLKQLGWSWVENLIKIYDPQQGQWESIPYEMANAQFGYNANIGENMYIEETLSFVRAIHGKSKFMNTLVQDQAVLNLLYAIELSDRTGEFIKVD